MKYIRPHPAISGNLDFCDIGNQLRDDNENGSNGGFTNLKFSMKVNLLYLIRGKGILILILFCFFVGFSA